MINNNSLTDLISNFNKSKSNNKPANKLPNNSFSKKNISTIQGRGDPLVGSVQIPYKFQSYLSLIIFGYFGIKIFLSWFKIYPKKYYQKKLLINTCSDDKNTENIVMNGYVPGLWNSEITDFIITVVLASITFVFTDMTRRGTMGEYGSINWFFLLGYLLGLNAPVFKEAFIPFLKDEYHDFYKFINYFLIGIVVFIMIIMIFLSARGARELKAVLHHKGLGMYIVYLIGIIIIVCGLVIFRKQSYSNQKVVYDIHINNKCEKQKTETIKMSGDKIHLSMTILAWLLSLIFVYDPPGTTGKYILYLVNGIVLGVFVSGMSYYGIEYLLKKVPAYKCNNKEKCLFPDNIHNTTDEEEIVDLKRNASKIRNAISYLKWLIGAVTCIVIALIIQNYYGEILMF